MTAVTSEQAPGQLLGAVAYPDGVAGSILEPGGCAGCRERRPTVPADADLRGAGGRITARTRTSQSAVASTSANVRIARRGGAHRVIHDQIPHRLPAFGTPEPEECCHENPPHQCQSNDRDRHVPPVRPHAHQDVNGQQEALGARAATSMLISSSMESMLMPGGEIPDPQAWRRRNSRSHESQRWPRPHGSACPPGWSRATPAQAAASGCSLGCRYGWACRHWVNEILVSKY